MDVRAGESTTLKCEAQAVNPEAEIRWSGAEKVSRVVNVTQLVVTPSWRDNGVKIFCRGRNPYYRVSLSGLQSITLTFINILLIPSH